MTDYIKANGSSSPYSTFKFTNGKFYKVLLWVNQHCAEVKDDNGRACLVGVGKSTLRLSGGGRFERVPSVSDYYAMGDGWRINDSGKMIASDNYKPAECISPERLAKAEEQIEAIKKALRCPDGFDVVKQAGVVRTLADALIKLQNSTNC